MFKGGLQRAAMDRVNPYRYFTRQDLRDLFKLDDPTVSVTQQQLSTLHGGDKVRMKESTGPIELSLHSVLMLTGVLRMLRRAWAWETFGD